MSLPTPPPLTPAPLSAAEVAHLKAMAQAATPGPWFDDGARVTLPREESGRKWILAALYDFTPSGEEAVGNAAFIAAANPETIQRLLADRAALHRRLQEAQQELEQRRLRYEQLTRDLLAEFAADPSDCPAEWAMLKSFDLTYGPFDEPVKGLESEPSRLKAPDAPPVPTAAGPGRGEEDAINLNP